MSRLTRRDALRAGGATLVAALAGCSAPTSDTTTPRTSTTASSGASVPGAAWTYTLDGEIGFGPAFAGGALYAGRGDGTLVSLDPATGEERWRASAGPGFFGGPGGTGATPTVSDGLVYAVAGARSGLLGEGFRVVALHADSGEEAWTYSLDGSRFLTLLGVHDGSVYAATSNDHIQNEGETLYALDAANGDVRWTATVGDPMEWALGAGGAYVATFSGLRAVSLADGSERWSKQGGVADGVHVTGDTFVAGFEPEDMPSLAGLDPKSGEVRWAGPNRRVPSYAAADGVVYAGGEPAAAYDAATGEEQWTAESGWGGLVTGPPVGGRLFVRREGFLHAFDAATGERQWGIHAEADGTLTAGSSLVAYVARSEDAAVPSTLVVRDAATGEQRRSVTLDPGTELTPPVVEGDTAFVATRDGRIAAFRP
ncbi:PQQ-binding-like beta-propeller repeat protein [Halarchaeum sp. P4]|uniref:outer membrane protein assembly factor BamB family protein n=1 Tax=Halarchaeum sp. P4 TaxID=3421639 RepID=UPI003EB9DCB3